MDTDRGKILGHIMGEAAQSNLGARLVERRRLLGGTNPVMSSLWWVLHGSLELHHSGAYQKKSKYWGGGCYLCRFTGRGGKSHGGFHLEVCVCVCVESRYTMIHRTPLKPDLLLAV
jgi:hypothetical protein